MEKKFKIFIVIILLLLIPILVLADTIYLKDGSIIKGEIIEINDNFVIIKTENGIMEINKNDILKIEFEPKIEDKEEEDNREEIKEELKDLLEDNENTIIIIIKPSDEDKQNDNDSENEDDDTNTDDEVDNYNWEDEDDEDDNYNWGDNNDNDGDHHYVTTGNSLIMSVGFVSVLDFFYSYGEPDFLWGLSVRLMITDVPISVNLGFNSGYNILVDYYIEETKYTLIADFWNIYSAGIELRFLEELFINPFISAAFSFHHLYMPFATAKDTYGALAVSLLGGIEFFIIESFSIQLFIRKHISLGLEDFTFGLHYDQSFYDALFNNFQLGLIFYFNFGI